MLASLFAFTLSSLNVKEIVDDIIKLSLNISVQLQHFEEHQNVRVIENPEIQCATLELKKTGNILSKLIYRCIFSRKTNSEKHQESLYRCRTRNKMQQILPNKFTTREWCGIILVCAAPNLFGMGLLTIR